MNLSLKLYSIPHSKPWLTAEDERAVLEVLKNGMLAGGKLRDDFTQAFLDYIRLPYGLTASSGKSALALALRALHLDPEDEVILPTYVCDSVMKAVLGVGATPVFCDSGPYWNMTKETVMAVFTPRTRAVIVVHIFGIQADTASICELGVPVIEDCCQALAGPESGLDIGQRGDFSVYSFHATKCLTTAEGGFVASRDEAMFYRVLAECRESTYANGLTDFQAALGLSQLRRYEAGLSRRRELAQRYIEQLPREWTRQIGACWDKSMFFRFPIVVNAGFVNMFEWMKSQGIAVRHGVDALLHQGGGLPDANFPNAFRHFEKTVSLPLYPSLSEAEQAYILSQCLEARL